MSNYVLVAGNLPTEAWNRLTGRRENWDYTELATSHLSMVTHPNELNKLLLNIENH